MIDPIEESFAHAARDPSLIDELRPAFRFAKIKPTDNCNSRCVTCTYWQRKFENELTLDEVKASLAQLRELGVEEVMFTGGEPTLRKDLVDMVTEASRLGFAVVGMTTNGLSLNEGRIDALLAAGLTEMVLSVEGLTLHDEIRGVSGNLDKIRRHLETIARHRAGGFPDFRVKLATTLMQKTFGEIPGMINFARDHGATLFLNLIDNGTYFFRGVEGSLFEVSDWAALDRVVDLLLETRFREPGLIGNSPASLEYARRYFKDPKQADIPCYLGYVGIEIDANGDVYSNCWGLPPVGNIRNAPLARIALSDSYRRRCASMYRKQCRGCSCGYILNLSYQPGKNAERSVGYAGERG